MRYRGEFKENLPNGVGIYLYSDGSKYKGQIKNGLREGVGRFFYSNGDIAQGSIWGSSGYP